MSRRPTPLTPDRRAALIAALEAVAAEARRLLQQVREVRADLAVTRRLIEVGDVTGHA